MSEIKVLCGISGSGKSSYARELCAKDSSYVRVNRDELRQMLFGYTEEDIGAYYSRPGIQYREKLVSGVHDKIIREAIRANKNVVVDNTHLKQKHLKLYSKYGQKVEYIYFDIDVETAVQRDSERTRSVGRAVIEKQFENYKKIKR